MRPSSCKQARDDVHDADSSFPQRETGLTASGRLTALWLQTAFSGVGSLSSAFITKTRLQALAQGLPHQEGSPKAATMLHSYSSRLEALRMSSGQLVQVCLRLKTSLILLHGSHVPVCTAQAACICSCQSALLLC